MKNKYYHEKVLLKNFLLNGNNSVHGIKRWSNILYSDTHADVTYRHYTKYTNQKRIGVDFWIFLA